MEGTIRQRRNARNLKGFSLLYLALTVVLLVLVHGDSYEPAVSFVPLYFVVSVGVTAAVAALLLPAEQFTGTFTAGAYAFCAAFVAMTTFFSGGASSELYLLFFPIVLAPFLHGSWKVGAVALTCCLAGYLLAVLPNLLVGAESVETPTTILFRASVLALLGISAFIVARGPASAVLYEGGYVADEDGMLLLEKVSEELSARRGVQVAVVLVDPGRKVGDLGLLLERVRARIGEPILVGEGAVFGIVLSGVDDRAVESAARRILAAAGSLGAQESRAGAAIYPRDARSPEDLLVAAGRALEAAFEVESPSAVVLASRAEGRRQAAH